MSRLCFALLYLGGLWWRRCFFARLRVDAASTGAPRVGIPVSLVIPFLPRARHLRISLLHSVTRTHTRARACIPYHSTFRSIAPLPPTNAGRRSMAKREAGRPTPCTAITTTQAFYIEL